MAVIAIIYYYLIVAKIPYAGFNAAKGLYSCPVNNETMDIQVGKK